MDTRVDPVEIADNTWWVGRRPEGEIFYANPYLRHFEGTHVKTGKQVAFNLLIDPGSTMELAVVKTKIDVALGRGATINGVYVNHQDPDVCSSITMIQGRYNPKLMVFCTEDTWRLIRYYNVARSRFVALERYLQGMRLPTGQLLQPVASPFCHFVGAMMLYDPETKVLFTGDLFGGLTNKNAIGIEADESDWVGIRAFHQIYMPTNRAMKIAIARIRQLDVELIAPQHGRLLRGALMKEMMDRLERLPVGLDILDDRQASADDLRAWTTVLNHVIQAARDVLGNEAELRVFSSPELDGMVEHDGEGVRVVMLGRTAVEHAVRLLTRNEPGNLANPIRYAAIHNAHALGLPAPRVDLDEGDSAEEPSEDERFFTN